jgi:hypothetical protein
LYSKGAEWERDEERARVVVVSVSTRFVSCERAIRVRIDMAAESRGVIEEEEK